LKPFGLRTFFHGSSVQTHKSNIKLHGSGRQSWVSEADIESNLEWVSKWKVLIPRATDGNENYPLPIWDKAGPFISGPNEACSETYLVASIAKSKSEAKNIAAYMRTKFFRFLIALRKSTQDNKSALFAFVPDLDYSVVWTDPDLYKRYGFSREDIAFIDSIIRDVDFTNE
jgi:site-specific DNA-methyltransferase (adenine-specific)